jgi:hypothetical protein
LELLSNTTFFRLIQIDVNRECKYSMFWKNKTNNASADAGSGNSTSHGRSAQGEGQEGGGGEESSSMFSQLESWMPMTVCMHVPFPILVLDLRLGLFHASVKD